MSLLLIGGIAAVMLLTSKKNTSSTNAKNDNNDLNRNNNSMLQSKTNQQSISTNYWANEHHVTTQVKQEPVANDFEEFIKERGITNIIHVTDERNIASIKTRGIMPKDVLRSSGVVFKNNDLDRFDGLTDGVCLSVSNPNLPYINKIKERDPGFRAVVIYIDPSIIYEQNTKCHFFQTNASATISKQKRISGKTKGIEAFKALFEDRVISAQKVWERTSDKRRNQPTDFQAEIIFMGTIDPKYFTKIEYMTGVR